MVHAVVAILEVLSVLSKAGIIKGCEEKVVTPLNVEPPLKLDVEVAVPIAIVPVVKLDPIFMAEVTDEALITFTMAVETLSTETFTLEKDCVPDQVFEIPFTYVQKLFVHSVVAALVELSVLARMVDVIKGCVEKVCIPDQVLGCVFT